MNKLKELYNKYYYISPLDQADSAESNRILNLYWSAVCFFVALAFLVLELVFKREYYHEHRLQILYMSGACLSIALSFVLSIATKNISREKAYILKTLPFYVFYCWCGTTCPIMLFLQPSEPLQWIDSFSLRDKHHRFVHIHRVAASLGHHYCVVRRDDSRRHSILGAIRNLALIKKQKSHFEARTFGNFTLLHEGKAVKFSRSKTAELVAYLICKNGSSANTKKLLCALYGEYADSARYGSSLRALISDAKKTFSELEIQNFFSAEYNNFRITPEAVKCDYYDFLSGDPAAKKLYVGQFMSQYSWAEETAAFLERKALAG